MKLNVLVLLVSLLVDVSCYDCYDQKCGGSGQYIDTYISCDQSMNTCTTSYYGYPECEYSSSGGNGVWCGDNFYCSYWSNDGDAYCSYYDNYDYVYPIVGCSILVFIITGCCVFCCRRRRRRAAQQTVIITQTPQVRPVIQNINVTAPPRNYGAVPSKQSGYQGQQGGYPGQQSGYPGVRGIYPLVHTFFYCTHFPTLQKNLDIFNTSKNFGHFQHFKKIWTFSTLQKNLSIS